MSGDAIDLRSFGGGDQNVGRGVFLGVVAKRVRPS